MESKQLLHLGVYTQRAYDIIKFAFSLGHTPFNAEKELNALPARWKVNNCDWYSNCLMQNDDGEVVFDNSPVKTYESSHPLYKKEEFLYNKEDIANIVEAAFDYFVGQLCNGEYVDEDILLDEQFFDEHRDYSFLRFDFCGCTFNPVEVVNLVAFLRGKECTAKVIGSAWTKKQISKHKQQLDAFAELDQNYKSLHNAIDEAYEESKQRAKEIWEKSCLNLQRVQLNELKKLRMNMNGEY